MPAESGGRGDASCARARQMLPRSRPSPAAPEPERPRPEEGARCARAPGLLTARIASASRALATIVGEVDPGTIERVRGAAIAERMRSGQPVTIELRYVEDPVATALVAMLDELGCQGVRVVTVPVRPSVRPFTGAEDGSRPFPRTPAPGVATTRAAAAPNPPAPAPAGSGPAAADPFGLDPAMRMLWLPPLRFLFERYWRVEVAGSEHVPAHGPALVVANRCGALAAEALMLAVALELQRPAGRCLRVLFDPWVAESPWLSGLYRRLGGVPATFASAELLLRRGEVVSVFPERDAGARPGADASQAFRTGPARLALRTGCPIIPVAIVGADDAYPLVAQLHRARGLLDLPRAPLTALLPLLSLIGAFPLPAKWRMRFCPPILPPPGDAPRQHEIARQLTERVHGAIAAAIHTLREQRHGLLG